MNPTGEFPHTFQEEGFFLLPLVGATWQPGLREHQTTLKDYLRPPGSVFPEYLCLIVFLFCLFIDSHGQVARSHHLFFFGNIINSSAGKRNQSGAGIRAQEARVGERAGEAWQVIPAPP